MMNNIKETSTGNYTRYKKKKSEKEQEPNGRQRMHWNNFAM